MSIISVLIATLIAAFSLWTMYRCLKLIAPENRAVQPRSVWICLIPVVSFIWIIVLIYKIARSLHAENFHRVVKVRRIEIGEVIGIATIGFSLLGFLIPQQRHFLVLGSCFLWIGYLICLGFQIKELKSAKV